MKFLVLALCLIAPPALALTTVDLCVPECDQHQLQWHADPVDPWLDVATPMDLSDIIRSDNGQAARGVEWAGVSTFGEFQALATRGLDVSPYSAPLPVGEPPVAPLMLAALGTLFVLSKRRR